MPWYDENDWPGVGYDDPGPPDLSPLPEPGPPLITLPIGLGPDPYLPIPIAGGGTDWSQFIKFITGGASALPAGGRSSGNQLADSLRNIFDGGGSISDWLPLLAMIGGIGASINGGSTAKAGGQQIKDAADKSNTQATDLLNKAMAQYDPYKQAGVDALAKLQPGAFDVAGKFTAAGTKSNLADKFKSGISLSQLTNAKR